MNLIKNFLFYWKSRNSKNSKELLIQIVYRYLDDMIE